MKYLLLITLLLTFSCSKKSNSFGDSLPQITYDVEEQTGLEKNKFPIIKLNKLSSMNLHIFDNENEHSYSFDISLKKRNYIRSKMERILYKSSNDKFELSDILKVELEIESSDKVKLFKNHRFNEVQNYQTRAKASFDFISSQKEGLIEDLSYKFSFLDSSTGLESHRHYDDLYRYENHSEEIDLSKSDKSYSLESGVISYSVLVNKLISGEKFIYEVTDYKFSDLDLSKWIMSNKDNSFIFVSGVDQSYFIQVNEGETILEAITKEDKDNEVSRNGNIMELGGQRGDWVKVNFSNVDHTLEKGEIIGIYLKTQSLNQAENTKKISSKFKADKLEVNQFNSKKVEFYIQQKMQRSSIASDIRTHKIIRTHGSSCDSRGNGCHILTYDQPAIKYCRADSPKLVNEDIVRIEADLVANISILIDGVKYTLDQLKEEKIGSYYLEKGVIYIVINPFSSISDYRKISILSKQDLTREKLKSAHLDCPTLIGLHSVRPDGRYNFMWESLEGFENYEEEVLVGNRIFLDLIFVN